MIDLKNTYIENDFGELRDLYIDALTMAGVNCEDCDTFYLIYEPSDLECLDGAGNGWKSKYNSRKLTLADLKPRTKTEHVKVDGDSIFHLKPDFEAGELYAGTSQFDLITTEGDLCDAWVNGYLYRKVEREITWQDEACNFFDAYQNQDSKDLSHWLKFKNKNGLTIMQHDFISMCHIVASLTDKPE